MGLDHFCVCKITKKKKKDHQAFEWRCCCPIHMVALWWFLLSSTSTVLYQLITILNEAHLSIALNLRMLIALFPDNNNNNNDNLSNASSQNEPKVLHNGCLQCTIIVTRYTNSQGTRDKYSLNMCAHTHTHTHTKAHTPQQKCQILRPPPPFPLLPSIRIRLGGGGIRIMPLEKFSF